MMKRLSPLLAILFLVVSQLHAQSLPPASELSTKPNQIESQIESILGESESEIMSGLSDIATNIGNLAVEKVLDEAIKVVADAAVVAPAAEKILSAYQKKKDQKLAKNIDRVTAIFKDGMERITKIRYQDLKVKVEHQEAMNDTPEPIAGSETKKTGDYRFTRLWDDHLYWIGQLDDPKIEKWINRYYDLRGSGVNKYYASYPMFLQSASLTSNKGFKAKQKLASASGKLTYLSPADRIDFYRQMNNQARQNSQKAKAYGRQLETALNGKRATWTQQQLDERVFRRPIQFTPNLD